MLYVIQFCNNLRGGGGGGGGGGGILPIAGPVDGGGGGGGMSLSDPISSILIKEYTFVLVLITRRLRYTIRFETCEWCNCSIGCL